MGIVLGAGGIMVISEDVVRGCWTEIKIEFMLRMVVSELWRLFRGGEAHEGASRCLSGGYLGSVID